MLPSKKMRPMMGILDNKGISNAPNWPGLFSSGMACINLAEIKLVMPTEKILMTVPLMI